MTLCSHIKSRTGIVLKLVFLASSFPLIISGCKNKSGPQSSAGQGSPAQTAATPGANQAAPAPLSSRAPRGVYSISEVDHVQDNRNVADMIPSHREIQISFRPDGSFMRVSWKANLPALSETGNFTVESPDHLVLSPTTVNKKPISDGRKTSYKYALSPDGYELKLWGARGNVAVFHRIQTL
jgi:hypothetical protein